MNKRLLGDGNDTGVYLRSVDAERTCAFTGETISQGNHCVVAQNLDHAVYLSVSAVDELVGAIRAVDESAVSSRRHIATSTSGFASGVAYSEIAYSETECVVCGTSIDRRPAYAFEDPETRKVAVYAHSSCESLLCEALSRVWEFGVLAIEQL